MNKVAAVAVLIICAFLVIIILAAGFEKMRSAVRNMKPLTFFAILLVLIAVIIFICVSLFGSRGEGSVFSENKEAESIGKEDFDEDSLINECLSEATAGNPEGDRSVYITVSGDRIRIGEKAFKDTGELKEFLGILVKTDSKYVLVDGYAKAVTYHEVLGILDSVGITYTEKAE